MKRKLIIGLLVLSLLAVPLCAACEAEEVTTTTPTTTPATTPTTPAEPVQISLIFSSHNPEMAPPSQAQIAWADWIEEQSGGQVEFTHIFGGGLLTEAEAFRGVQTGIAHLGIYVVNPAQGFLLNTVTMLPFMGWSDRRTTSQIYQDLLNEFPEMAGEWEGLKLLAAPMMPPTHIHTVDTVIRTPEDMDDMLFGTTGERSDLLMALGAAPVEQEIGDWPASLERGLFKGVINHFEVLQVFGMLGLLPYHTVFESVRGGGINMTPICIVMNLDTWNSLPADIQAIFEEAEPVYMDTLFGIEETVFTQGALDFCEAEGHTFTYLTAEEIEAWYDVVKGPVHDAWIAAAEAAGLPGQEIYDRVLELIEQYKAQ